MHAMQGCSLLVPRNEVQEAARSDDGENGGRDESRIEHYFLGTA